MEFRLLVAYALIALLVVAVAAVFARIWAKRRQHRRLMRGHGDHMNFTDKVPARRPS